LLNTTNFSFVGYTWYSSYPRNLQQQHNFRSGQRMYLILPFHWESVTFLR